MLFRSHRLVREQALGIVRDPAGLRAARAERPSVIVSAEGGDFLEGRPERIDEAYQQWQLRHLQLTHYRPNELGDIQTEPAVHGGLTPAGAEVIRRCNRIGVVVDVAHGTYDLVKQAATVATKPLVLSHTSLTQRPAPWTRLITSDHAKAVASTGGVIGIWPRLELYPTYQAYADAFARMVDVAGIDHVGLGSDFDGATMPFGMEDASKLPKITDALLKKGYSEQDITKILGGNILRVMEQVERVKGS